MRKFKIGALPFVAAILVGGSAVAATVAPDAVMIKDGAVSMSLTGAAGSAEEGRKVFISRKQGNCLACHINGEIKEHSFHGEVGPPLDGVADRYEEPELRAILVNSKAVFEDSIMPSFYRVKNGVRTHKKFKGKTILSAQQVEDVLAYLKTLKEE